MLSPDYIRLHAAARDALKQMRNKIWTARKSGNVSRDAFNENLTKLEALERYFNYCNGMMNNIQDYISECQKESYGNGYQNGYKAGIENTLGGIPNKFHDKEAYRSWSILKLQQEMPELF